MSKKTANPKKAPPSRSCEKCKKNYHPAYNKCPKCQAPNPTRRKKPKPRSVRAVRQAQRRPQRQHANGQVRPETMDACIALCAEQGGFDVVMAGMRKLEAIRDVF